MNFDFKKELRKKEDESIKKLNQKILLGIYNGYLQEKFKLTEPFTKKNMSIIKRIAQHLQESEIDFRKFSHFLAEDWERIRKELFPAKNLRMPELTFVLTHLNNLILIYKENKPKKTELMEELKG